jgi:dihydropyrimidinase
VVWDPNGHTKLGINDKHHMNMDHSAWEGFEIDGKVDTVMSRGMIVMENDTFTGRVGHGKYVKRGPVPSALPALSRNRHRTETT